MKLKWLLTHLGMYSMEMAFELLTPELSLVPLKEEKAAAGISRAKRTAITDFMVERFRTGNLICEGQRRRWRQWVSHGVVSVEHVTALTEYRYGTVWCWVLSTSKPFVSWHDDVISRRSQKWKRESLCFARYVTIRVNNWKSTANQSDYGS